jgi:polyhydroxyalkanoate synthesis regulator phasin
MKKKNIVLSLTMALMIGIGTTAYAATSNSTTGKNLEKGNHSGMAIGKMGHFKGSNILNDLLKENGTTDDEIQSALDSGKSLYDLATEKGITDDQIKEYMLSERTKHIDDAVTDGKITTEQAEEAKTKISESSANWNANDENNGMMKGFMNTRHDSSHGVLTSLLKEQGVTDDEIQSALDSDKSLYDLATEKGITDDQIKEYMITEGTKRIDDAVTNGKMTAEQAEEAKIKLNEVSANCNFESKGNGMMKGFMQMEHKSHRGMNAQ